MMKNNFRTIQGSVTGPFFFAVFIRPLYDIIPLTSYADDNYLVESDKAIETTIGKVKMKSEILINWFRDSRLKVNESKTEICILHRSDFNPKTVDILGQMIKVKESIKVLGIIFEKKLNWQ